ncbi:MAG: hypothetical protein WD872_19625 [Pirellulaceae bacterium]
MRAAAVRAKIEHLINVVPFRPFVLSLENGQTVSIEHPENIAFEPGDDGSQDFYVLTKGLHLYSSFSAVTSIALLDEHASVGDGE